MRVLLVEDQAAQIQAVTSAFDDDVDFLIATNRDEALQLIETQQFDLAICDLRIPPSPKSAGNVEHGLAVLTAVRDRRLGTPIVTFTAYKTKAVLEIFVREQRREDFLGKMQDRQMLLVMQKDELPELIALLEELRKEFAVLDQIEVARGLGEPDPGWTISRIVRVYARQRDCVLSRIAALTGGLSGIPVIRVTMEKADGSVGGSAVARIAPIAAVEAERVKFQQRVSGVLPLGSYAEIVGIVRAGAGNMGAVFYQVAENAQPLWSLPIADDARAAAAVDALRLIHRGWTAGAPADTIDLREIRRILIADQRWSEVAFRCGLEAADIDALEDARVYIRRSTVHADFHGGNVLVAADPVIIDFASVTAGPTPLDPVSLELSLLFHPDAPVWAGPWPTVEHLERWSDIDAYVAGCPFPLFIRACRTWATETARGDKDVYGCAYAYVASQARFDTSQPDRLASLVTALRGHLG